MAELILRIVAGLGVILHCIFAFKESIGWDVAFVNKAAPSWNLGLTLNEASERVTWARHLAANVAAYNLALAAGLAWVAVVGAAVAGTMGVFMAIWLLLAAVAAALTGVRLAAVLQGGLGLLLFIAALAM
jgi:uncharacterized membrane protein